MLEILSKPEEYDRADKVLIALLQGLVVDVLKSELQREAFAPDDLLRLGALLEERLDALGRGSAELVGMLQKREMQREELLLLIAQARERLKGMTGLLLKSLEEH
ncbi:hypothetical protein JCM9492_11290 [Aquifex pyrophilus]